MKVLLYGRKCRPHANYSLENVFSDVATRLQQRCLIRQRAAPCYSNGILPRLRIIRDVQRHQLPVTHVTGDISFAILGAKKESSIVTIPDCGFVSNASRITKPIKKLFWLDWPIRHASLVTTISNVMREEIIRYCPDVAPKVHVVPVAISDLFQPRNETCVRPIPRILHIGTATNKNLVRLIQAIQDLPCELTIIGVIPHEAVRLLHKYQVTYRNRVGLTANEVAEEYRHADLLAFVSTYEGFGMPILEAQATGIPVLTSNVSSMPEVAGVAALLVDPFNVREIRAAITQLLTDTDLRDSLIERGFSNVKRFNGQAIAEMYFDLYQKIWSQVEQTT